MTKNKLILGALCLFLSQNSITASALDIFSDADVDLLPKKMAVADGVMSLSAQMDLYREKGEAVFQEMSTLDTKQMNKVLKFIASGNAQTRQKRRALIPFFKFLAKDAKFENVQQFFYENFAQIAEAWEASKLHSGYEKASLEKNEAAFSFKGNEFVRESGYREQDKSPSGQALRRAIEGEDLTGFVPDELDPYHDRNIKRALLGYIDRFLMRDTFEEFNTLVEEGKDLLFLKTLVAGKILLESYQDLVSFTPGGRAPIVISGGQVYDLLTTFKSEYEAKGRVEFVLMDGFKGNFDHFKEIAQFFIDNRDFAKQVPFQQNVKDGFKKFVDFEGDGVPMVIYGGAIYDFIESIKNAYDKVSEIRASKKKKPTLDPSFVTAIQDSSKKLRKLSKDVMENLDRNLFSRYCSEQKGILELLNSCDPSAFVDGVLRIVSKKAPCPMCSLALGKFSRQYGFLQIRVEYHEDYMTGGSTQERAFMDRANNFARECNVIYVKTAPFAFGEETPTKTSAKQTATPDRVKTGSSKIANGWVPSTEHKGSKYRRNYDGAIEDDVNELDAFTERLLGLEMGLSALKSSPRK